MNDIEAFGWVIFVTLILVNAVIMLWPKRRNRRVGLPAPKHDDRDSIANFKRMHRP